MPGLVLWICHYDSVVVVVGSLSRGTDSIACRDIRYKGEDTSAYRYIERSSGSCEQAVSDAATAASSVSSPATEMAAAGELAGSQPRPITKQQADNTQPSDLSQPVDARQPEPTLPTTLQQTGLPAVCQPQSTASQQLGPSHPIAMQTVSQPIVTQTPELSRPIVLQQRQLPEDRQLQPITTNQPGLSQPIIPEQSVSVAQSELSRAIALQQAALSQPITTQCPQLSDPAMFQQRQVPEDRQPQPITTNQPGLSQPITVAQSGASHPYPALSHAVTTQCPHLSDPAMSQQRQVPEDRQPQPITMNQPLFPEPVTTQQPVPVAQSRSSHDLIRMQHPALSQPVAMQQQEPANPAVSSLPTHASNQQSVTGWYRPSVPCLASNPPSSVPTHPPASTLPVLRTTVSPAAYANTPPIPQPTFIQDFVSRPPPPPDFSTSPARALQPPIWSALPPPVAGSSMPYPPRPSSSPTPGILCRPLSPEVRPFVPTRESAQDPGQTEKVTHHVGEGAGDGLPPSVYAHSKRFHMEFPPTERRAASLPPEMPASSGSLGYSQRDVGRMESFNYAAGQMYDSSGSRGGETYGYGVYPTPYNFQYYPPPQNMWRSGQPTQEFQSSAEFPAAESVPIWSAATGYLYPSPGASQPVMYHMPSGGPPWGFSSTTVDYGLPMSSSSEIPTSMVPSSQYPPSTMPQVDVVTRSSDFSGDQLSVSSNISSDAHRQSYADKVRSAPTFQQTNGDVPRTTTERSDAAPESCERDETIRTNAGNFSPGNSALVTFISFF